MPENSTHKCTNAVNNVQPIRNSSHMAKILAVYNRLQAGDYENGNGGKRRVTRLTQFIHVTLQLVTDEGHSSAPVCLGLRRHMDDYRRFRNHAYVSPKHCASFFSMLKLRICVKATAEIGGSTSKISPVKISSVNILGK